MLRTPLVLINKELRNHLEIAEKRNEQLRNALRISNERLEEARQHESESKLELLITKEKLKIYSKAATLSNAQLIFCSAAIAFADAKSGIEDQANDYKRTLAALQAARGKS